MNQPGISGGDVPDGIVGANVAAVEVQSSWAKPNNSGCELGITLDSGRELFVICLGIDSVDATEAEWRARVGAEVTTATPIVAVQLETGGRQVTLDLRFSDGHRCEADLLEVDERVEDAELETEWTFEGTPGEEMGER